MCIVLLRATLADYLNTIPILNLGILKAKKYNPADYLYGYPNLLAQQIFSPTTYSCCTNKLDNLNSLSLSLLCTRSHARTCPACTARRRCPAPRRGPLTSSVSPRALPPLGSYPPRAESRGPPPRSSSQRRRMRRLSSSNAAKPPR